MHNAFVIINKAHLSQLPSSVPYKQTTTFIQLLTKTNILVSSVKKVHFLQTSPALDSDGVSNLPDCKWIKLMCPSLLRCRVVFIGLISLHKSYSASWLSLMLLVGLKTHVPGSNRPLLDVCYLLSCSVLVCLEVFFCLLQHLPLSRVCLQKQLPWFS